MGFAPDHHTEGVIYATHILANMSDPKFAVLMQNDDFGKDLLSGLKQGLGSNADKIVRVATYEVADPTVDSQIIQLKGTDANVLVNIATAKFAAQAIRKAAELGWRPAHYLSYVSASVGAVMKPAAFEMRKVSSPLPSSRTRPTRSGRGLPIFWNGRRSCRAPIPPAT